MGHLLDLTKQNASAMSLKRDDDGKAEWIQVG